MAGNTYLMKFSSFVMVRYKKTVYNEVMLLIVKKRENEKRKSTKQKDMCIISMCNVIYLWWCGFCVSHY